MTEQPSSPTNSHDPVAHLLDVTRDYPQHDDLTALQQELASDQPSHDTVHSLIERLRINPELENAIGAWANDPRTQSFLAELNALGL